MVSRMLVTYSIPAPIRFIKGCFDVRPPAALICCQYRPQALGLVLHHRPTKDDRVLDAYACRFTLRWHLSACSAYVTTGKHTSTYRMGRTANQYYPTAFTDPLAFRR